MNSSSPRRRILLICPRTFSYYQSIEAELEALGFDVTWWDDRGTESSIEKIGLRVLPEPFAQRLTAHFEAKLAALDATSVSHVLVVKGEGLSVDFIHTLRQSLPNVPMSLYFWDSIDNAPRAQTIAPLFDHVATFDPVDAATQGWNYRPLFSRQVSSDKAAQDETAEMPIYDWSFIGTLHSDRYRVVDRLRRSDTALRTYFFGYAPNRLLMAARLLADWRLWCAPRGSLSTHIKPAADVAAIVRRSRAVLDVEHPRQRGLTMRTIETLLAGRKLVTTNRHILQSDLYDETRVHVIDRRHPAVPTAFLASQYLPVPEAIRGRYSMRRWITDLLDPA